MANRFIEGDVVQLKSGGPKMTVIRRAKKSDSWGVGCKWFAGNTLKNDFFHEESLTMEESLRVINIPPPVCQKLT